MNKLPIVYVRGYGGPTAGINAAVEDPFYGFNSGSTQIRVAGDGAPAFYQFEGPLIRLINDEGYQVHVHGSQQAVLDDASANLTKAPSIWIYRFYDQAATTFTAPPHENLAERLWSKLHQQVTCAEGRMRYTLTLRLFKVPVAGTAFDFTNNTEQVPYWQDWLIVDVEPDADAAKLRAYAAWGSMIPGADLDPSAVSQQLPAKEDGQDLTFTADGTALEADVFLPGTANQQGILGGHAKIRITVSSR